MARKILLADDSVTAQNMGRKILTDAGYEVVTVNNGSAALKKVGEAKPDLIVLDVYMPGYSGLEVCQRIKENRETARIPILLTVGKLEPFKPEEARRARADAFVVKPFEASELLAALTKLEDKIVPQPEPYKPGRFAKAVASVDPDATGERFGDKDGGWKARLQIPKPGSMASDSEPDVDYAATQGKGFHDLKAEDTPRKGKAKAHPPAVPERSMPAGIPHDITPEEIAAITAAAERLNRLGTPIASPEEPVAVALAVEVPQEEPAEQPPPVTFASAPEIQTPEPVESAPEIAIAALPQEPVETAHKESEATSPEIAPEGHAPSSEPEVATPQPAVAAAQEEPAPVESPQVEAVTQVATEERAPVAAEAEPAVAAVSEPEATAPVPLAASEPESAPLAPAPHPDDDVMAALQSLMPADNASSPVVTTDKKLGNEEVPTGFAAIVAAAESVAVGAHSVGPRWVAQEIPLAAGDATLSLEREMQEAYSAFAAKETRMASSAVVVEAEADATAIEPEAVAAASSQIAPAEEQSAVHVMATAAGGDGVTVSSTVVAAAEPAAVEVPAPQAEEIAALAENASAESVPIAPEGDGWSAAAAPVVEESGGTEDMVAQWKNIRDSIAGSGAKPAPAKEEFSEPEPVKLEPEAASPPPATEKAHASSGANDPTAIASIVDSVLAELRPKIVEEIAKKLSDTKK